MVHIPSIPPLISFTNLCLPGDALSIPFGKTPACAASPMPARKTAQAAAHDIPLLIHFAKFFHSLMSTRRRAIRPFWWGSSPHHHLPIHPKNCSNNLVSTSPLFPSSARARGRGRKRDPHQINNQHGMRWTFSSNGGRSRARGRLHFPFYVCISISYYTHLVHLRLHPTELFPSISAGQPGFFRRGKFRT